MKKICFIFGGLFILPMFILIAISLPQNALNNAICLHIANEKSLSSQINVDFNAQSHIGLAREDQLSGKGVTVAILDTGIYPNHSVFTDNESKDWNERIIAFYDSDEEGLVDDPYDLSWHGTWTASILAGNSSDYIGVAPDANLVIMKVFEQDDGDLTSKVSIIEDAVDWIIDHKKQYDIQIVSMSFGAQYEDNPSETQELNAVVEKLIEENILVVTSSGNYGSAPSDDNTGTVSSPGSAKSVLTVGGVDYEGEIYERSGEGPTFENIMKPDVCAPAVEVLGAQPGPPNNLFASHSGTSASTPYVSGLAALLLEEDGDLDALEIKYIISMTSYRTYNPRTIRDNTQGWGIVQGYAAIDALKDPIQIDRNFEMKFILEENKAVMCQPITLKGFNHYIFELQALDEGEAEVYLFDSNPDEYGNPILISHSINIFSREAKSKTMGAYIDSDHDYFLIVKGIYEKSKGEFKILLVIDYKLGIVFLFSSINSIALVIVAKQFKSLKQKG